MATGDGDKRKVTTDALETLGTIIDDKQKRDAIHLAVEPVVAGERLDPGDHVSVKNGIASFANRGDADALGIVDPFLSRSVRKDERFWFVMYPRMVHSLRHVWTHPAFPDEVVETSPVGDELRRAALGDELRRAAREIAEERAALGDELRRAAREIAEERAAPSGPTKAQSEAWLRDYCARTDCPGYESLIRLLTEGSVGDDFDAVTARVESDYVFLHNTDGHGLIPPEFWTHVENVTGVTFPHHPEYFSCSC